jgi:hypothetical protein
MDLRYKMHSDDSEELCWRYDIVGPENATSACSLVGIVDIYELARAGRWKDVSENIHYPEARSRQYYKMSRNLFRMIDRDDGYLDRGLAGACRGGQKGLALMIIHEIESSGDTADFNWGLGEACHGRRELALLMIEKGATDLDGGLGDACLMEHKELVTLMIEKGAKECKYCGEPMSEH